MGDFNKGKKFGGSKGGKKFGGKRDFGGRSFGGGDRGGERSFGGGNRGGNRNFSGDRDRERPEMFSAICSDCGKKCEVPFRPSGDKPVLCSDCFRNKRSDSSRDFRDKGGRDFGDKNRPRFGDARSFQKNVGGGGENYRAQFEILNAKLDKILKAIAPNILEETTQSEKIKKAPKKEVDTVTLKKTINTAKAGKADAKVTAPKKTAKTVVKKTAKKKK